MEERRIRAVVRALFVIVGILAIAKLTTRAHQDNGVGDHVMFFRASRAMLAGENPYVHGYLYLPFFAFLLTPIAVLPPMAYGLVWGLFLGGLWIFARSLIRKVLKTKEGELHWAADILPSVLLFRYIYNGWGLGQVVLPLLVLSLFALLHERRGDEIRAAFCLSFAAAIKFFPAFLGIVFIARRRWRAVVWTVPFGILLTALPILETGPERFAELLQDGFLGHAAEVLAVKRMDPSHTGVIAGFWYRVGAPPTKLLFLLEIAWALVCISLILRYHPTDEQRTNERLWLAFVVTSMLVVAPYLSKNYLTFLLLPFAASVQYIVQAPWNSTAARWLKAGLIAATFAFNFYSPWLLGREVSIAVEKAISPTTLGVFLYWFALLRAVENSRDELA